MSNNPQKKLLSNDVISKFLEKDHKLSFDSYDKFSELSSSLAYYLKSFSNIKRFLDYISLVLKHTFNQQLTLIIPFTEKGEIWKENIKFSGDTKNLEMDEVIKSYFEKFYFSKNLKKKEIISFDKVLNNKFKQYIIESYEILSRGKCRGFVYTFNQDLSNNSVTNERNLNFIISSLAVGLENYWLIKTKKSMKM